MPDSSLASSRSKLKFGGSATGERLVAAHGVREIVEQAVVDIVQTDANHVGGKVWEEWFGFPAMRMVDGKYPLPEKPGLGFELTEDASKKYPFAGTRPMARAFHKDGSVVEW